MNAPDAFALAGELLRRIAAESKVTHARAMERQMQTAQALRGHVAPPPPRPLDFGSDDDAPGSGDAACE